MTTEGIPTSGPIDINVSQMQKFVSYKYLGQKIAISRDNQTSELYQWIGLIWVALGNLWDILKLELPVCLIRKVFNEYVLPVLIYGADTLTLTRRRVNKIHTVRNRTINVRHIP